QTPCRLSAHLSPLSGPPGRHPSWRLTPCRPTPCRLSPLSGCRPGRPPQLTPRLSPPSLSSTPSPSTGNLRTPSPTSPRTTGRHLHVSPCRSGLRRQSNLSPCTSAGTPTMHSC